MKYYFGLCLALTAGCGGDDSGPTAFDHGIPDLSIAPDLEGEIEDGGPDLVFNPGPVITIDKPAAGDLVGGTKLIVQATIADPAGIVASSVLAVFGGDPTKTTPLLPSGTPGQYVGTYDVSKLGVDYVAPNLSVRATDNQGLMGETAIQVFVDNTPPKLSLTPPKIRVAKFDTLADGKTKGWICSHEYNPVGDNQPVDGAVVPQLFWLRAFAEDRGNWATGLNIERVSGIDPASVEIVAMPVTSGSPPLIVHTVGNPGDVIPNQCDDVNPVILPMSGADMAKSSLAVTVAMAQVPLQGAPDFTPSAGNPTDGGTTVPSFCDQLGDVNATAPAPICPAADPSAYYITPVYLSPVSGIWSIPPVKMGDSADCVGTQFDSLNEQIQDGPTCIVVRARDLQGNHNVSQVLHVCINHTGGTTCPGAPSWNPNDSTTWPDCTGTYDPSTNQVTSTPCTPWTFDDGLVFGRSFDR